ncbi:hypothetical protein DFR58_1811, partial [Anaerobacterium chartisolvens]
EQVGTVLGLPYLQTKFCKWIAADGLTEVGLPHKLFGGISESRVSIILSKKSASQEPSLLAI